ncbi:MAG: hypothetical protein SGILL_005359 [Bacillariaceae sp.]
MAFDQVCEPLSPIKPSARASSSLFVPRKSTLSAHLKQPPRKQPSSTSAGGIPPFSFAAATPIFDAQGKNPPPAVTNRLTAKRKRKGAVVQSLEVEEDDSDDDEEGDSDDEDDDEDVWEEDDSDDAPDLDLELDCFEEEELDQLCEELTQWPIEEADGDSKPAAKPAPEEEEPAKKGGRWSRRAFPHGDGPSPVRVQLSKYGILPDYQPPGPNRPTGDGEKYRELDEDMRHASFHERFCVYGSDDNGKPYTGEDSEYYYFNCDKFECWVANFWDDLSDREKVAVRSLRWLMENPLDWDEWKGKKTERHHWCFQSQGGNPGMDPRWTSRLSAAGHMIAHIDAAILMWKSPDHEATVVSCWRMNMGFHWDIQEMQKVLLEAGAPTEIAEAYKHCRQLFYHHLSLINSGDNHPIFGKNRRTPEQIEQSRAKLRAKIGFGDNNRVYGKNRRSQEDIDRTRAKNRAITGFGDNHRVWGKNHNTEETIGARKKLLSGDNHDRFGKNKKTAEQIEQSLKEARDHLQRASNKRAQQQIAARDWSDDDLVLLIRLRTRNTPLEAKQVNELQYSVESVESFHKHVYDEVVEGNANKNQDETMSKAEARQTLGFDGSAGLEKSDIKSAYRKMSFELHPDRFEGTAEEKDDATLRFSKVKLAYETLSSGVRGQDGVSCYESLGGRARTGFVVPVDLLPLTLAHDHMQTRKAVRAIVRLQPPLVQSFVARHLRSE